MYGHKDDVYKKKYMPRKEWRVKKKEHVTGPMPILEVAHTIDSQNASDLTVIKRGGQQL